MYSYIFYLKAKAKQTFILKGAHARTSCGWDSEPRRRPSAFALKRSVQTLRTLPKVQFDFNPGASGYRLVHHVRRRGKIRNRAESAHWENEVFWLGERAPPAGCGEPRAVCRKVRYRRCCSWWGATCCRHGWCCVCWCGRRLRRNPHPREVRCSQRPHLRVTQVTKCNNDYWLSVIETVEQSF